MAVRGPTRSSQAPKTAAEEPRQTMATPKTQATEVSFQSSAALLVIPITLVSRRFKTEKT